MAAPKSRTSKKRTVKELNEYVEALEQKFDNMEKLIKDLKIIQPEIQRTVNTVAENVKKIDLINKNISQNTHQDQRVDCRKCDETFSKAEELKNHMTEMHPHTIKCKFCIKTFKKTCELENHLSEHVSKEFKCEKCSQEFHLKWRLNKHLEGHNNIDAKYCHYFNNSKVCPFQELGCMFKHLTSPVCKYKFSCNRKMCPFKHETAEASIEVDPTEKVETEKELDLSVTNVTHNKLINQEKYQSLNEFDNSGKFNTFNIIYKCCKCDVELSSLNLYEDHIEKYHQNDETEPVDRSTWCAICDFDYYDMEDLETHENTYHNTSCLQKCDKCDYTVYNEARILRHEITDHPNENTD